MKSRSNLPVRLALGVSGTVLIGTAFLFKCPLN